MNLKFLTLLFFLFLSNFSKAQCVSGNCYNGKGKMVWTDGSSYEGDWLYGTMHGEGAYKYSNGGSYYGKWKLGVKHGYGEFYWKDGTKYRGDWFGDSYTGSGALTYTYGETKIGDWVNGNLYGSKQNPTVCRSGNCINGNGVVVLQSGDSYEGGFIDGNFSGRGVYKYAAGGSYEGELLKGAFHGKGKITFSNGDTYEGDFQFGVRHGYGVYKFSSAEIYEGNWFGSKRSGIGKYTYSNGVVLDGFFINGTFIKKLPFSNYSNKLTDTIVIRKINNQKLEIINKYNNGEINPLDLSIAYSDLGKVLFNCKLYNDAVEIYNYSIELYSKNSVALLFRASVNRRLGNNELACEDYKRINENMGERRRLDGFYEYVGDTSSNGLRNGMGTVTYCDGFVEKGLWVDGAFIGEWKFIDNRHKCYQCGRVLSISKKITADQIRNVQKEGVLTKSNIINLYICEEYCSVICKNKAFALQKAREKQYAREMQSSLSSSRNQTSSNTTSSSQSPGWHPCEFCNKIIDKPYYKRDCEIVWRKEAKPGYLLCSTCQGNRVILTNVNCNCGYQCYKSDCYVRGCIDGWYECSHCNGKGQVFW